MTPAVERACATDKPVIVFDRGVQTDCPTTFIHPIGGYAWGIDTANFLSENLAAGDKVVALRILAGVDVLETRWAAAKKIFDEKGIEAKDHFTDADPTKIKQIVTDAINQDGVKGVWMDAGDGAVAAIEAFEDAGVDLPIITGEDEMSFLRKWEATGLTGLAPVYSNFQWRTPLLAVQKIFAGEAVPRSGCFRRCRSPRPSGRSTSRPTTACPTGTTPSSAARTSPATPRPGRTAEPCVDAGASRRGPASTRPETPGGGVTPPSAATRFQQLPPAAHRPAGSPPNEVTMRAGHHACHRREHLGLGVPPDRRHGRARCSTGSPAWASTRSSSRSSRWVTSPPDPVRAALDRTGLIPCVVGAMAPGRDLVATDPDAVAATQDYLRACVDLAADIGAAAVCGPFYAATGRVWRMDPAQRDAAYAQWRENLAPGRRARRRPRGARGHRAAEPVRDLAGQHRRAGADRAGRAARARPRRRAGHLPPEHRGALQRRRRSGPPGSTWSTCRCAATTGARPGGDQTDWAGILAALDEVGYAGPLVIESFTADNAAIATAASIWRPLARDPGRPRPRRAGVPARS